MRKNLEDLFSINDKFYKNFDNILNSYKSSIDYAYSFECDRDFDILVASVNELEIKYIQYSKITLLIYSLDDYILDDFIEFFKRKVKEKEIEKLIQYKKIDIFFKIISHIELSVIQKRNLYYSQQNILNELNFEVSSINKKNKELENKQSEIEKIYKNIMVNFVSILGIFASIIFAVFGGFKQIESIGIVLTNLHLYRLFIYVGLVGVFLSSILLISFFSISKLSGLNLKSCCKQENCNCCLFKKYSLYFCMYGVFILLIFLGLIGKYIK